MRFHVPSECLTDVNCDAHDSFYIESVSSMHNIYSVLYSWRRGGGGGCAFSWPKLSKLWRFLSWSRRVARNTGWSSHTHCKYLWILGQIQDTQNLKNSEGNTFYGPKSLRINMPQTWTLSSTWPNIAMPSCQVATLVSAATSAVRTSSESEGQAKHRLEETLSDLPKECQLNM